MDNISGPLFRAEVIEARKQRVEGEIVLAQPVRTHVLAFLLFGLIALIVVWLTQGSYTRTETARGILQTSDASAKIVAIRPGQVAELLVQEGAFVRAGKRLVTIRTEQADDAGESTIGVSLAALETQRLLAGQQEVAAGRRAGSERARLAATLAGLVQQRADLAGQVALQEEAVASASDLLTGSTVCSKAASSAASRWSGAGKPGSPRGNNWPSCINNAICSRRRAGRLRRPCLGSPPMPTAK